MTKVVEHTNLETLVPNMVSKVTKGSIVVSDEWYREGSFGAHPHVILNHSEEEYVRGAFHTNTIEGFWRF